MSKLHNQPPVNVSSSLHEKEEKVIWVPDNKNIFTKCEILTVNGSSQFSSFALQFKDILVCANVATGGKTQVKYGIDDVLLFDPSHELAIHDLGWMNNLNNAAVLNTVRLRFEKGNIYTAMYPLFISVNPYQNIPNLYSTDRYNNYMNPEERAAHIFTVVERALDDLLTKNQCIIVRGESGAGKTEACKRLLEYLIAPKSNSPNSASAKESHRAKIHHRNSPPTSRNPLDSNHQNEVHAGHLLNKKLMACNPILEAFGNAVTLRNDNSSRFGKYLRIEYSKPRHLEDLAPTHETTLQRNEDDTKSKLQGATFSSYLLERSRVVGQQSGERNYHIFYQLLCGLRDTALFHELQLGLFESEGCSYLCGSAINVFNTQDANGFAAVSAALADIGIPTTTIGSIWRLLAGVLHLGNVRFEVDSNNEWASVCDTESVHYSQASSILGISTLGLHLTSKSVASARGRKSMIMVNHSADKAVANACAIAKEVYERLFVWLVRQCNSMLSCEAPHNYIGLLDLFGFEVFQINSFEQLCINYCNERLQALFNETLFEEEIKLYAAEGIKIEGIDVCSNRDCIDLFEADSGLFKLLDVQCMLGRSQTSSQEDAAVNLLAQFDHAQSKNAHFSTHGCVHKLAFSVIHFAGKVEYVCSAFLSKNTDKLEGDMENLLVDSNNEFIAELFAPIVGPGATSAERDELSAKPDSSHRVCSRIEVESAPRRPTVSVRRRTMLSVGAKFRANLKELLQECSACSIQYVKCLKPNSKKLPNVFDPQLIYAQLKYSGILEVVRVRQLGFPLRETWSTIHKFAQRNNLYVCTVPGSWQKTDRASMFVSGVGDSFYARKVISKLLPKGHWHEGRSKVFMKSDAFVVMLREHQHYCSVALQRRWRGCLARNKYRILIRGMKLLWKYYCKWKKRKQWELAVKGMTLLFHRIRYKIAIKKVRYESKLQYFRFLLMRWKLEIRLRKRCAVTLILLLMRRNIWRRKMQLLPLLIYRLQARCRGNFARQYYNTVRNNCICIQRIWRRALAVTRFVQLVYDVIAYLRRGALVDIANRALNGYRKRILYEMRVNLFAAARVNDVETLLAYLRPPPDSTPLFRRAVGGSLGIISLRDSSSGFSTLLHTAAEANSVEFVQCLLRVGAAADAVDADGNTAVHRAVLYGDQRVEVVKHLLRSMPIMIHSRNNIGLTPALLVRQEIESDPSFQGDSSQIREALNMAFDLFQDAQAARKHRGSIFKYPREASFLESTGNKPDLQAISLSDQVEPTGSSEIFTQELSIATPDRAVPGMLSQSSVESTAKPQLSRSNASSAFDGDSNEPTYRKISFADSSLEEVSQGVSESLQGSAIMEIASQANAKTTNVNKADSISMVKMIRESMKGPNSTTVTREITSQMIQPNVSDILALGEQNLSIAELTSEEIGPIVVGRHISEEFKQNLKIVDHTIDLLTRMQELYASSCTDGFQDEYDDDLEDQINFDLMHKKFQSSVIHTNDLHQFYGKSQPSSRASAKGKVEGEDGSRVPFNNNSPQTISPDHETHAGAGASAVLSNALNFNRNRLQHAHYNDKRLRRRENVQRAAVFAAFASSNGIARSQLRNHGASPGEFPPNINGDCLGVPSPPPSDNSETTGNMFRSSSTSPISEFTSQLLFSPTSKSDPAVAPAISVMIPQLSFTAERGRRNSAFKNQYGDWILESDFFGNLASPPTFSSKPASYPDHASGAETRGRPTNESPPGTIDNIQMNGSSPLLDATITASEEKLQVRIQQHHDRRQSQLRAMPTSVLTKKFHQVFEKDVQSVPSIFEHFKEYIDPSGEFDIKKIKDEEAAAAAAVAEMEAICETKEVGNHHESEDSRQEGASKFSERGNPPVAAQVQPLPVESSDSEEESVDPFGHISEDLVPQLTPFVDDPDERRRIRHAKIIEHRRLVSDAHVNHIKPLTATDRRDQNLKELREDREYGRLIAHHRAIGANPIDFYLATNLKTGITSTTKVTTTCKPETKSPAPRSFPGGSSAIASKPGQQKQPTSKLLSQNTKIKSPLLTILETGAGKPKTAYKEVKPSTSWVKR